MTQTVDNGSLLNEYYELCKPRVVMLIVFTAIIGMFLAVPLLPPIAALAWGTLGITLQAASAAAINQIIDRGIDANMARTCGRPLVTGRLGMTESIAFATVIGLAGFVMLWFLVNPLTALLTQFALVGYAGIYTLFLKRATPQNIVIGGAAGAAPPVLGWAAATGEVHAHALILFLIIFIWTPPHFWALAIERRDEYAKAGIPMLPVTHGIEFTRTQVLLYTILLVLVTTLPYLIGMSGPVYLLASLVLNFVFLRYAVLMKFAPRPGLPMKTFGYSIVYLMGIFSALLVDHYVYRLLM
ncbi:protoheme IX farnesyltransferase [Hydrocarboniphaga daqingensis]|jgi:protoheme IX farnesyltransferase|uniref:Protoheme IX farnesyltransferase n=1 Tax=Hydrocarboniphaga daqingensis TaxID=490188 RepID=A0A1M5NA52_9GAMM|nr:heme o synthase [Hydrocarboniphaga daqingensis]SHG86371.1 protoheme IX farnesyltransferase [Hydrocarboniphaga daqingensis]